MDSLQYIALACTVLAFLGAVVVIGACLIPAQPKKTEPVLESEFAFATTAAVNRLAMTSLPAHRAGAATIALRARASYATSRIDLMLVAKSLASDRLPLGGNEAFALRAGRITPYVADRKRISLN